MSRRGLAILMGVQAALLLGWWWVEARRTQPRVRGAAVAAAVRTVRVDAPAPPLVMDRDGARTRLSEIEGPIVLHFWATWCPPCRAELPGLLAYAARSAVPVRAVSVDADWATIQAYLDAEGLTADLTRPITRASAAAARAFGVTRLPVTVVIDARHRARLQLHGARDWSTPAPGAEVRAALRASTP